MDTALCITVKGCTVTGRGQRGRGRGRTIREVAAREKAEAAKRRSEEMLTKELALKKEGEAESREFEKLVALEMDNIMCKPHLTPSRRRGMAHSS